MDHAVFFKDRDGRDIQDEEQRIKQILIKNASNLNNQSQNRNLKNSCTQTKTKIKSD